MKNIACRLVTLALAAILLMTISVASADTRYDEDAGGYRYAFTTSCSSKLPRTISINAVFAGRIGKGTVKRFSYKGSEELSLAANVRRSDVASSLPSLTTNYSITGNGSFVRILLTRTGTTYRWVHYKQLQHREAGSNVWKNVGEPEVSHSYGSTVVGSYSISR